MDSRYRIKYNDNITLVTYAASGSEILQDNEFYALMIEDRCHKAIRDKSDFWDYENGYIGLEQTSSKHIYISKNYNLRENLERGLTFIIEVKEPDQCCYLMQE
jgi:hypothetical protein